MTNRYRNERIEIKLTKEEKELFMKKLELSKSKSMVCFAINKYKQLKKIITTSQFTYM